MSQGKTIIFGNSIKFLGTPQPKMKNAFIKRKKNEIYSAQQDELPKIHFLK